MRLHLKAILVKRKANPVTLERFEKAKLVLDHLRLDHLKDLTTDSGFVATYLLGPEAFLTMTVLESDPIVFRYYYKYVGNPTASSIHKVTLEKMQLNAWAVPFDKRLQEFVNWAKEHSRYRKEIEEKLRKFGPGALTQEELNIVVDTLQEA